MLEMSCELLESGVLRMTFSAEDDNYCQFHFEDLGDLEGFLMECHEMAVLAANGGTARQLN